MNNELAHYGVLGMKWGVRKDSKNSSKKRTTAEDRVKKEKRKRAVKRTLHNAATLAFVGMYAHAVLKDTKVVHRGKNYTNTYLKKHGNKSVKKIQEAKTWADYAWEEVNKI